MKQVIQLLLLSTILLCFLQCRSIDLKEKKNIDLQNVFKHFIISNCDVYSSSLDGNKKQPLEVTFYEKNKKVYVVIVETVGLSFEKIKGYCEYENYMIAYYGVDDSLAKKYLNLSFHDIDSLKKDYINLDDWFVDLPDSRIKNYRIKNDTIFEQFKPTKSHTAKYRKLMIEAGLRQLPPPPPF